MKFYQLESTCEMLAMKPMQINQAEKEKTTLRVNTPTSFSDSIFNGEKE